MSITPVKSPFGTRETTRPFACLDNLPITPPPKNALSLECGRVGSENRLFRARGQDLTTGADENVNPSDSPTGAARCRASPSDRRSLGSNKEIHFISQSFNPRNERMESEHDDSRSILARPSFPGKRRSPTRPRMSPEQLRLLSRRIDPTEPLLTPHDSPTKPPLPVLHCPPARKRSRLSANAVFQEPDDDAQPSPLFQTCANIWQGPASLGEFSHENIQYLSELLKVRLSQAKFRVLANLEAEGRTQDQDGLFKSLKSDECCSWPEGRKKRCVIQLPVKRHHMKLVTVGNGNNLFARDRQTRSTRSLYPCMTLDTLASPPRRMANTSSRTRGDVFEHVSMTPPPTPQGSPLKERKRKRQPRPLLSKNSPEGKHPHEKHMPTPTRTPKRRPASSSISPVVLDDGSRVFLCNACDKKYKNKNGLLYHLDRCKYLHADSDEPTPEQIDAPIGRELDAEADESQTDEDATILCICGSTTENGVMVQCDDCHCWLHSDCVGFQDTSEIYQCPRCLDKSEKHGLSSIRSKDTPSSTTVDEEDQVITDDTFSPSSLFGPDDRQSLHSISLSQEPAPVQPVLVENDYTSSTMSATTMWNPAAGGDLSLSTSVFNGTPWSIPEASLPSMLLDTNMNPILGNTMDFMTQPISTAPSPQMDPMSLSTLPNATDDMWFDFANFENDFDHTASSEQ